MQDVKSNIVYVVSLGDNAPDGGSLSWIEIVRDADGISTMLVERGPKSPQTILLFVTPAVCRASITSNRT